MRETFETIEINAERLRVCKDALAYFMTLEDAGITPQALGCVRKVIALAGEAETTVDTAAQGKVIATLVDEIDTAFAVLGICDALDDRRGELYAAWVPIQNTLIGIKGENSFYARSVRECRQMTRGSHE